MEHIERAGIHSGDPISVYPAQSLSQRIKRILIDYTGKLARELKVVGLVNIQYVVYNDDVYVIEVNPRSSRTIPYISKVTGVPMVDIATRMMFGEKLVDQGYGVGLYPEGDYVAVKVPVFSFEKLHDVDTHLGPEMKSTGEVLGIAKTFEEALYKGLVAAGYKMEDKAEGKGVLISVRDSDKQEIIKIAEKFEALGYDLYATGGTASLLNRNFVATSIVKKIGEGEPNIMDLINSGKLAYIISTSKKGRQPQRHSVQLRRKAVERSIPCLTALDTANALADSLKMNKKITDVDLVNIVEI
jgi:carbamoyl-phosphate synthase large subunit